MPVLPSLRDRPRVTQVAIRLATAAALAAATWTAYMLILWPDMTKQSTTPLRGALFALTMVALLVAAARWTGRWWIGMLMPLAMSRALIYVVDHSGTNSDGLEDVGALLTVIGGLPAVFVIGALVVHWARFRLPPPPPYLDAQQQNLPPD